MKKNILIISMPVVVICISAQVITEFSLENACK